MYLYEFQFHLLPSAVKQFQNEDYTEILAFKDDFIKLTCECLSENGEDFVVDGLSWEDLKVLPVLCTEDVLFVVYQFPKQSEVPLCDYVGFWHNRKTKTIHYYTYEVSFENTWVFGTKNASSHANYGSYSDGTLTFFVSLVIDKEKVKEGTENKKFKLGMNIFKNIFK